MKKTLRVCWFLFLLSYGSLELFKNYILNHNNQIGFVLVPISAITVGIIFFSLIFLWARTKFVNKALKVIWLIVLIVGSYYMIGPAIFYLLVIELKKTVSK